MTTPHDSLIFRGVEPYNEVHDPHYHYSVLEHDEAHFARRAGRFTDPEEAQVLLDLIDSDHTHFPLWELKHEATLARDVLIPRRMVGYRQFRSYQPITLDAVYLPDGSYRCTSQELEPAQMFEWYSAPTEPAHDP